MGKIILGFVLVFIGLLFITGGGFSIFATIFGAVFGLIGAVFGLVIGVFGAVVGLFAGAIAIFIPLLIFGLIIAGIVTLVRCV